MKRQNQSGKTFFNKVYNLIFHWLNKKLINADEKKIKQELIDTKNYLNNLLELTQAEQRERKRLAGILHDNLQQLLVGANWAVHGAQKKTNVKDIQPLLERTSGLLEESISVSKSLVLELSTPFLYEWPQTNHEQDSSRSQ